jgi:hypothetical protein
MRPKPHGASTCNPADLDCICKADNRFEGNIEFDQQCVLDECFGDLGKEGNYVHSFANEPREKRVRI